MKTPTHKGEKEYTFYLLKEIADWLSAGMVEIKSSWSFVWDENRKDFKAINKSEGSSLEIHLRNISGFVSKKPEFNMCIFPRKRRGAIRRLNVDTLKFVEHHCKPCWEPHKIPDILFDGIIRDSRVGTSDNKPLKSPSFRGSKRDRLSDTNEPISRR
jgi:hypothetical protein